MQTRYLITLVVIISFFVGGIAARTYLPRAVEVPREWTETEVEAFRAANTVTNTVERTIVERMPLPQDYINALNAQGAGHLAEIIRQVTSIKGVVRDHRVHVEHDTPAGPLPICEPGEEIDPRPAGILDWHGGCDTQILTDDRGGRFARALWTAGVAGKTMGVTWDIDSGPPVTTDVAFEEVIPPAKLPRSTSWGLGVGLWSPRASVFDAQAMASLRRSRFAAGRRWGWWAMLESSVSPGDVSSGTIGVGVPAVKLGGAGLQIGIERRSRP